LVPALRSFRLPARYLLIWALVVPVLAAVGFNELLALRTQQLPRHFRVGLLIANFALMVQFSAIVYSGSSFAGGSSEVTRLQMLAGSLAGWLDVVASILGMVILMAVWRRRLRGPLSPRVFVACAYAAIFFQFIVVALPNLYTPVESLATVVDGLGRSNIRTMTQSGSRVVFHMDYLTYPALADVFGFRSATTYDPLLLSRTAGLIRARQEADDPWGRASNLVLLDRDGGVSFDVLGVGYFLRPGEGGARLLARSSGLPRLSLVSNVTRVNTAADSMAAVLAPGFDPHRDVVLEQEPGILSAMGPAGGAQRLEILAEHPGFVRATVEAPTGGYLVFSESYYPGWQAEANGQVIPLVPADHAIMTVRLSPGSHTVTLRFTIPWLVPSLAISVLGLVGIFGLALWPARRSKVSVV